MIEIIEMLWVEDMGEWQIDYIDSRNGIQRGRRYIKLPQDSNEKDVIKFIEGE